MKTTKLLAAGLALVLACGSAAAQATASGSAFPRTYGSTDVADWLEAARGRNRTVATRRLAVESARVTLAALENPTAITFSAETGTARLSFDEAGAPALLSAEPTLALTLADPWGTIASLGVGTEAGFGAAASEPVLEPALSIRQPLDGLLDSAATLELLRSRASLADAESELAAAEARCDAETLNLLMGWSQAVFDAASKRHALDQAGRELDEARALGTYAPGSAGLARLAVAVESASIALERSERALVRAAKAVETATGLSDADPPAPPVGASVLPALSPDDARGVAKAKRTLAIAERAFAETWERGTSLAAELSAARTVAAGVEHTTARVGAVAEWEALSISSGAGWTGGAGGGAFLDLSLSWNPEAGSSRNARLEVDALSLDSDRVALEAALDQARTDLADLAADLADRELESRHLAASLEMAALEAAQLRVEAAAGFAAESEVDEAVILWIQAAAAAEKAAWQRAAADALVAADFSITEVSE